LYEVLQTNDRSKILAAADEWGLEIREGRLLPKKEYAKMWSEVQEFWDKKQLIKKINLNSLNLGRV
jgi:hypothetical protein